MELEEMKLYNQTLKHDNDDLRKRIANVTSSDDESIKNHLQIIEDIISERDDLKELLDKFLSVTDQIVELKVHADLMRNIERDYLLLQTKCRDHHNEVETLRSERTRLEDRILELQTTNTEVDVLKVCQLLYFLHRKTHFFFHCLTVGIQYKSHFHFTVFFAPKALL